MPGHSIEYGSLYPINLSKAYSLHYFILETVPSRISNKIFGYRDWDFSIDSHMTIRSYDPPFDTHALSPLNVSGILF
ncbi:unnamed protein product [Meloidogyne enterolobii]|uniref:Uncharacterized protein n=1 Tax=Meloidogyne enterolobii TaxID=390850 RepID=A0ACB1B959_MELEN